MGDNPIQGVFGGIGLGLVLWALLLVGLAWLID